MVFKTTNKWNLGIQGEMANFSFLWRFLFPPQVEEVEENGIYAKDRKIQSAT